MNTALIYDERFKDHLTGADHPERPERLRAVIEALRASGLWDRMHHPAFEPAGVEWIKRVHEPGYVARIKEACASGMDHIDSVDSVICRDTYQIARLAVGGVLAACDLVMAGRVSNAFCPVRPPGHHAERDRSMGFCMFNNIAVAAEYLIHKHHLKRVAIVDFDVHHGNGTQHSFWDREDIFFVSIHEHPWYLYPGSGFDQERGGGPGEGRTLNCPVMPRAGDSVYRSLFQNQILPALTEFNPQFLLISAGFDAASLDPLAHVELSTTMFNWMTQQLKGVANQCCDGRLVSVLEGGYHLDALGACAVEHVSVLCDTRDAPTAVAPVTH